MDVEYHDPRQSGVCRITVEQASIVTWQECLPMRTPTVHKNTRCKPGRQYVVSIGALVTYESLVEAQFLLLADWLGIAWVLPQPMRLHFDPDMVPARHIPDFLLCDADGVERLVDVCSPKAAATAKRQACHAATAAVCAEVGWSYEVFTGFEDATGKNLGLLAHHAIPHPLAVPLLDRAEMLALQHDGVALGHLVDLVAIDTGALPALARCAVLALLWSRRLLCDIAAPVTDGTEVRPARAATASLAVAA